jgi:hypothetical protein
MAVTFTLNGKAVNFDGDPETPILWVLRDHLDVTSPKIWLWCWALWSLHRSPRWSGHSFMFHPLQ